MKISDVCGLNLPQKNKRRLYYRRFDDSKTVTKEVKLDYDFGDIVDSDGKMKVGFCLMEKFRAVILVSAKITRCWQ